MYRLGSFRAALGGLAVAGAIVVFATPAWAHGVAASGTSLCADDASSWSVAWSVSGTHNEGNDIASVSATDTYGAVGLAPAAPASWDTVFTGVSTYPTELSAASLSVQMSFANGEHRQTSASVSRPEACVAAAAATSTTSAQPIAPPTSAVESTTSTAAPPTTAPPTTEGVTTTAATSTTAGATVSTAGAVRPAEAPSSTAAPAVLAEQVTTTTTAFTTSAPPPVNAAAASAPVLPATGASGVGTRAVLGGLLLLAGLPLVANGRRARASTS